MTATETDGHLVGDVVHNFTTLTNLELIHNFIVRNSTWLINSKCTSILQ